MQDSVIKDDQVHYSEIFDKYAPALYGRILNVVKNKEIADKILERVFVNSYNNREEKSENVSDFTALINESRNSTYQILKSVKLFNAIACGSSIQQ